MAHGTTRNKEPTCTYNSVPEQNRVRNLLCAKGSSFSMPKMNWQIIGTLSIYKNISTYHMACSNRCPRLTGNGDSKSLALFWQCLALEFPTAARNWTRTDFAHWLGDILEMDRILWFLKIARDSWRSNTDSCRIWNNSRGQTISLIADVVVSTLWVSGFRAGCAPEVQESV